MTKPTAFKVLRMVVSAGIIAYRVATLDLGRIGMHLKSLRPGPILLAAAADLAMISTNSLRGRYFSRPRALRCRSTD